MERIENLDLSLDKKNSFGINLAGNGKKRRLVVESPVDYGVNTSSEVQDLIRATIALHLIGPHLPKKITTDFPLNFSELLNSMYDYYGLTPPKIVKSKEQITPNYLNSFPMKDSQFDSVNVHSGGLDSSYRAASLLEKGKKTMAVHVRNFNPKVAKAEGEASRLQARRWGLGFEEIKLTNNSGNTSFISERTRYLVLAGLASVLAGPVGAKTIYMEGAFGTDRKELDFSENSETVVFYNRLLKESGVDVDIVGVVPGDIETIGEILRLEKKLGKEILPLVVNCFSAPNQRPGIRRKWERETPTLAKESSENWCGSCFKCRRTTLGRLVYKDKRLDKVSKEEVAYFINDTAAWIKKFPNNKELLSDSFLGHLDQLSKSSS